MFIAIIVGVLAGIVSASQQYSLLVLYLYGYCFIRGIHAGFSGWVLC